MKVHRNRITNLRSAIADRLHELEDLLILSQKKTIGISAFTELIVIRKFLDDFLSFLTQDEIDKIPCGRFEI